MSPAKAPRIKSARRRRGRPKRGDAAAIERTLLTTALEQFLKHGYGATSMNTIAKAARVSKTTLYSRYPSKEALFRAIMHEQIERIARLPELRPTEQGPDLKSGLTAYANLMLNLSLKGDLLEVNRLIYSESQRFPELGAAAAERSEIGVRQIADFIRTCARADGVPCSDPEAVAQAFIMMIRGWYVNVMLTNRKVSTAERQAWVERAVRVLLAPRSAW